MTDVLDFWRNDIPKCPHCECDQSHEFWMVVSTDDGDMTEMTCECCDQTFVAVCEVEYKWRTAVSFKHASDEQWGPQDASDAADRPLAGDD